MYIELASAITNDFDSLFELVKNISWKNFLRAGIAIVTEATAIKSTLSHTPSIQSIAKKAIVSHLTDGTGTHHLYENRDGDEAHIQIFLIENRAHILIDITGNPLHKRGYRTESGDAPIKENLAAAILAISGWRFREKFLDPFCGSGTFAIEAAMLARNIAPGLGRHFAVENFPFFEKEKLKEMGAMKRDEKIMLGIFVILLLLWAGVPEMLFGVKVDATATTFLGLSLCLLTGVLTWDDALKEKGAWDTIVWFAALVMMANFLNKLGLIAWLSESMQGGISHLGLGWEAGCALLVLAYLYAHYVFASGTAHVTAMFGAFYGAGLALGAPPMLFALVMASATGIMMSLTHYATGSAPVIYCSNYVTMTEWWKAGFIMSVLEILIFGTVGILWWKVLGYW